MASGPVLVVDFGAQYAQLIARRVREANVYSELVPHSMPVDEILAKDPQAIILSGGPASVFEPGAPRVDKKLFEAGVPVLGICYGFQAMAYALGADVDKAALGEYGKTETVIDDAEGLLAGSPDEQNTWMSHGVAVKTAPEGFEVLWRGKEPMALLDMKRNIADEGIGGVLRILRNVLGNKDIRARVLNMKHTFDKYSNELTGIAFVVRKPEA